MELLDSAFHMCPYCGAQVEVELESTGPHHQEYIEDCSVCCRPWKVSIDREDESVSVQLFREDE